MTKGKYKSECYRTVCRNKGATFFNHSTEQFYCAECAKLINEANRSDAFRLYGHDLCIEYLRPSKAPRTH